jgi:hypothetical protein
MKHYNKSISVWKLDCIAILLIWVSGNLVYAGDVEILKEVLKEIEIKTRERL